MTNFVVSEQARNALTKLGRTASRTDAKQVLLDAVRSAWEQVSIWQGLLNSVPPEDFAFLGRVPIAGVGGDSVRGARIEIIQKHLTECTKVAARTSKLALDAGIEERLVRLAEEQSALIADTVRAGVVAAIGALRLSPAAEKVAIEAALGAAGQHLRALASGAPEGEVYEGIAREVHE